MVADTYQKELNKRNLEKIDELLDELPSFVRPYIVARFTNTSTRTRLVYIYDYRVFFNWLRNSLPELINKEIKEITLDDLGNLNRQDIEEYMMYLQIKDHSPNSNSGLKRKLASLSTLYDYYIKSNALSVNPCKMLTPPKLHDKEIIKLTYEEVDRMLNIVKNGSSSFSWQQEGFLKKTRVRDYAIVTLLLTTGIRVSECVGLDLQSLNFNECTMSVIRKGGKVGFVELGDEAISALKDYLAIRRTEKVSEKESALFLSIQGKRMGVQSVENMVKKYAKAAGISKPITPHKLRKTYGTELYKATGDIYLVAAALGHKDIKTTVKHYAAQNEESLLNARNVVKFN